MKKVRFSAVCAILMAVLSGCQEEASEPLTLSQTSNMQISVQVQNPLTKSMNKSTSLPDGSQIGVMLADDTGSGYENKNYSNVLFTASGSGTSQAWSSSTDIGLSVTKGKATAYYPYDANVTDATSIPMDATKEIDYLYSGEISQLSNSNAVVSFSMKHALSAVGLEFKEDGYTGQGHITKIEFSSDGFCKTGTLDARTGEISAFSGYNEAFSISTDSYLTTDEDEMMGDGGTVHEKMVIPDVSITKSTLYIKVTVDGTDYKATCPMTTAFEQGRIYRFSLLLSNERLSLQGVSVNEWTINDNGSAQASPMNYDFDEYVIEVEIPSNDYTINSNVSGFTGTVDWGDGTSKETCQASDNNSTISHTYRQAGTYRITHKGSTYSLGTEDANFNNSLTDIIYIGPRMYLQTMRKAFDDCVKLSHLREGIFNNLGHISDFSSCFEGCTALETVPASLFDYCRKIKNADSLFEGCSNMTSESPYTMVDGNKVHLYERDQHPDEFVPVERFGECFYRCEKLADYQTIESSYDDWSSYNDEIMG